MASTVSKDYNAWIAKIACKRIIQRRRHRRQQGRRQFISMQLAQGPATTEQAYQFLGAALRSYCPDKMSILEQAAQ